MIAPEPVPGETMVQWEAWNLNNATDIANADDITPEIKAWPLGTVVGGDDALHDGSPDTYLEVSPPGSTDHVTGFRMRPLSPVPGPVLSVSMYARWVGYVPGVPSQQINLWAQNIADDRFPWIGIYPESSTVREELTDLRRTGVFVRVVQKYVDAWDSGAFWALWGDHARIYEWSLWTHHEGVRELPLRQRQRDDHLAPGGVARARAGSSRQGSIRQRGYV